MPAPIFPVPRTATVVMLATVASALDRQRERQHRGRPAARIALAASVSVQPVTTWSSTSSTRAPSRYVGLRGSQRRPTAATRWAELTAPRPGATSGSTIAQRPTTGTWRSGTARRRGRRSGSAGVADSTTTIASTSGRQSSSIASTACDQGHRDRAVGRVGPEQRAQRLAVAEVGEPGDGAALARRGSAILPLRSMPRLASAVGHILRGSIGDAGPGQPVAGLLDRRARHGRRRQVSPPQLSHRPQSAASGSSSCSRRNRIRQPVGVEVVEHRLAARARGPRATRA